MRTHNAHGVPLLPPGLWIVHDAHDREIGLDFAVFRWDGESSEDEVVIAWDGALLFEGVESRRYNQYVEHIDGFGDRFSMRRLDDREFERIVAAKRVGLYRTVARQIWEKLDEYAPGN